jgi:hypothetical protein
MQLLIMQFSPTSCHFIPLRSKYSPKHPVLNLCSSLNVRDQFSHPYKTTGKIIVYVVYSFVYFNLYSNEAKTLIIKPWYTVERIKLLFQFVLTFVDVALQSDQLIK